MPGQNGVRHRHSHVKGDQSPPTPQYSTGSTQSLEGRPEGATEGLAEGWGGVGSSDGLNEGLSEGSPLGRPEGSCDGFVVGTPEGSPLGPSVGNWEGSPLGSSEGSCDGITVGTPEGLSLGPSEGACDIEGTIEGGTPEGCKLSEGLNEGPSDGWPLGCQLSDGVNEGASDGWLLGPSEGWLVVDGMEDGACDKSSSTLDMFTQLLMHVPPLSPVRRLLLVAPLPLFVQVSAAFSPSDNSVAFSTTLVALAK